MAKTVKQSFSDYASNLNITAPQTSLVASRRKAVVEALNSSLYLHDETPSRLIGSYDRSTLTRYLSEGDVDVMVVLHYGENKSWETSDGTVKALDAFRRILDDAFPDVEKRRDRNCITMKFQEFRLDVVPAFKYTGGYYNIPDSVRRTWVKTDPFKFQEKVTEVNRTMGGSFVPLIKMIKGWNREVGWPIRSFHLECMMLNRYMGYTQGYTYDSMVKVFFENLPALLQGATYDPIMNDRVDTYLDESSTRTRAKAIAAARRAADLSKEAFADTEKYEILAIGEWKQLMGTFFPSYG